MKRRKRSLWKRLDIESDWWLHCHPGVMKGMTVFTWILGIVTAAIVGHYLCHYLWLGGRAMLADQFVIPTHSMEPTLIPGDRIIVDKRVIGARIYSDFHFNPDGGELKSWRTRGARSVGRNDIVVFNYPYHGDKLNFVINHVYAKRCLALPGDSIAIVNGHYRNNNFDGPLGYQPAQDALGQLPDDGLPPEIVKVLPYDDRLSWTIKDMPPIYIPRRGDIVDIGPKEARLYRKLLEWETGKTIDSDWDSNTVTADGKPLRSHRFTHSYYFMAGDNAINSHDSRYFGLVPEEYIIGIATLITYSEDKSTGQRRPERTMKSLVPTEKYLKEGE